MTAQSPSRELTAEEALLLIFVVVFPLLGRPPRVLDLHIVLRKGFKTTSFPPEVLKALDETAGNATAIFKLVHPGESDQGLVGKGYMQPEGNAFRLTLHGLHVAADVRERLGYTFEETEDWVIGLIPSS